ncbi:hypothetical protein GCM10009067_19670 [Haloarcula sebkhae]|uniref:Uncharacterized protein n=1 Tax=Haloarcula sebkhae TaxID=932660 RepID=A0A830EZN6_9EURY|nr:hypothetical protein GCM10009067_19670 [Haloarcula sebkhae]
MDPELLDSDYRETVIADAAHVWLAAHERHVVLAGEQATDEAAEAPGPDDDDIHTASQGRPGQKPTTGVPESARTWPRVANEWAWATPTTPRQ